MKESIEFLFKSLEDIRDTGSRIEKEKILKQMILHDRETTKQIFDYALNSFYTYGVRVDIDAYSLPEEGDAWGSRDDKYKIWTGSCGAVYTKWSLFKSILDLLKARKLTGGRANSEVSGFLNNCFRPHAHWFACILNQNLRIGLSDKTIKKYFPGLLPENSPMLCAVLNYQDRHEAKAVDGWILEPKYDGIRALAVIDNGKVTWVSRAGKDIWNTDLIEEQLLSLGLDNVVIDGELYAGNFRETMSIVHTQTRHKNIDKLKFFMFDMIRLQDWKNEKTPMLSVRKIEMQKLCAGIDSRKHPNIVEVPFTYLEWELLHKKLTDLLNAGFEGAVVKDPKSEYQWERSKSWRKVKPVFEGDFEICGFVEGNGKNSGTLGAVIVRGEVEWQGKTYMVLCRVGGGFSDEIRDAIWTNQKKYRGMMVQVEFKEVSFDKSQKSHALREPVFVRERPDKKAVSK